jgi:hypothetical protein
MTTEWPALALHNWAMRLFQIILVNNLIPTWRLIQHTMASSPVPVRFICMRSHLTGPGVVWSRYNRNMPTRNLHSWMIKKKEMHEERSLPGNNYKNCSFVEEYIPPIQTANGFSLRLVVYIDH